MIYLECRRSLRAFLFPTGIINQQEATIPQFRQNDKQYRTSEIKVQATQSAKGPRPAEVLVEDEGNAEFLQKKLVIDTNYDLVISFRNEDCDYNCPL